MAKSVEAKPVPAGGELLSGLERYRYPALVVGAILLVILGQLLEDAADGVVQMGTPAQSFQRWMIVILVLYELLMAAIVYRSVRASLHGLRRVVRLKDAQFEAYERAIRLRDWSMDVMLFVSSSVIVVALFVVLGLELFGDDPFQNRVIVIAGLPVSAIIVLAGYATVGWAGLKLLHVAWRFGRQLGRLSHEPLEISVFDTTPLLPFGNIALAVALAPAGIIAILLVTLGAPSTIFGWTVLVLASVASLLALLLPLRGVHRQMSQAKDAALAKVNERLGQLFEDVTRTRDFSEPEAARLNERSGTLIPIRETIEKMPTWPFRDTLAFGRAVLIALAPLVYTTLSELIRVFLIAPLSR